MRRVLVLLLSPTLILGCAGAPVATTAPSVSASPSALASPSGSFLTWKPRPQPIRPSPTRTTRAIDAAHAKYPTRQTLEDHQRYWGLLARADKAFIDGLKKIAFPPELQADAAVLIKADTSFQERARAVARARSVAEVISLSAAANDAADVVATKAAILRKGLGLGY